MDHVSMENMMKEDVILELKGKNLDLTRDALENEEKYLSQVASLKSLQAHHNQLAARVKSDRLTRSTQI